MNFEDRLQRNHERSMKLWWETPMEFPPLGAPYTHRNQLDNEQEVDRFIKECWSDLNSITQTSVPGIFSDQKVQAAFDKLPNLRLTNIVPNTGLTKQFIDPFMKMARDFITSAYQFEPNLKPADVHQALRNLWTAGSLQLLMKQPPHSSPAIFAYSMLYPYTDNYLDDPAIPVSIKGELNQKFKLRLAGEAFVDPNSYERALDRLVGLIENQFPRLKFPEVYRSLLAIHQAQVASLLYQSQPSLPHERDILGISFQKGGCSVLADGYLVNGDLTEAEAAFSFGYGVFLQLVDDLRDAGTDSQSGQMTIFSQIAHRWPLDRLTNRTIHFSRKILKLLGPSQIDPSKGPPPETAPQNVATSQDAATPLLELIQNSVTFLILEAISRNQNLYSKDYLHRIEEHTPFRLSYLRKLKGKLMKNEREISGATLLRFVLINQLMSRSPGSSS